MKPQRSCLTVSSRMRTREQQPFAATQRAVLSRLPTGLPAPSPLPAWRTHARMRPALPADPFEKVASKKGKRKAVSLGAVWCPAHICRTPPPSQLAGVSLTCPSLALQALDTRSKDPDVRRPSFDNRREGAGGGGRGRGRDSGRGGRGGGRGGWVWQKNGRLCAALIGGWKYADERVLARPWFPADSVCARFLTLIAGGDRGGGRGPYVPNGSAPSYADSA
jgi:hypothetical protein